MRKARTLILAGGVLLFTKMVMAQSTFPENGVADPRHGHYAFTHATIVKDATTTLNNATLIIKDGKIVSVGTNLQLPAGAVEVNCSGKYIYPSFIDIYADYGIALQAARTTGRGGFNAAQQPQLATATKGAYGWNQAIKSDADAYRIFSIDEAKAKALRESGFDTCVRQFEITDRGIRVMDPVPLAEGHLTGSARAIQVHGGNGVGL